MNISERVQIIGLGEIETHIEPGEVMVEHFFDRNRALIKVMSWIRQDMYTIGDIILDILDPETANLRHCILGPAYRRKKSAPKIDTAKRWLERLEDHLKETGISRVNATFHKGITLRFLERCDYEISEPGLLHPDGESQNPNVSTLEEFARVQMPKQRLLMHKDL